MPSPFAMIEPKRDDVRRPRLAANERREREERERREQEARAQELLRLAEEAAAREHEVERKAAEERAAERQAVLAKRMNEVRAQICEAIKDRLIESHVILRSKNAHADTVASTIADAIEAGQIPFVRIVDDGA